MTIFTIAPTICGQVKAPNAVITFYGGINQMAEANDAATMGELEMLMRKCFFGDSDSGMNLPNDFKNFTGDKNSISHKLATLTSNNYINKLSTYMFPEKRLSARCEINSFSEPVGELPDFEKGRMSASPGYVRTIVRKKYVFGTESRDFLDTVYTHAAANKIQLITNASTQSRNDDVGTLKVRAAEAFGRKEYTTAFNLFKKIIELEPRDGESYLRLALMSYYGKGCRKSKTEGKKYIQWAKIHSKGYLREKAELIANYWRYPNQ